MEIDENAARFPAAVIVHWPGKSVPVCIEHSEKLMALAEIWGMPQPPCNLIVNGPVACSNCVNEAASRARIADMVKNAKERK